MSSRIAVAVASLLGVAPLFGAPQFVRPPVILENPNPAVPLAAVVRFEASEPVEAEFTVSDGKHRWTLAYPLGMGLPHGYPIVGMRAGRQHSISVRIRNDKGESSEYPAKLAFVTPPLPSGEGEFPPIQVTVTQPDRMEPGLTLFSPRRNRTGDPAFGAKFGMLVMVDAAGEPVWFYRTDSRISDLQRLSNGNFAFLTQDYRAVEIDMLGNEVATWYATGRPGGPAKGLPIATTAIHHELDEVPNGNFLVLGAEFREIPFFTSDRDPDAPKAVQKVMGDEVIEFTRDGREVWRWRAFDALDPNRIGYETFDGYWERRGFPDIKADFSHANGLLYDHRDDSVLVNFRMLSNVVKIDRKTKEIRWILGDPKGLSEELRKRSFRLEPASARWFFHQHAPSPTPWGTFMVFDNGNYRRWPFDPPLLPGETYSRAVEYELDEKNLVARQVWTSERDPAPGEWAYSVAMGDVDAMPRTGNVLVHYGMLLPRTEAARKAKGTSGQFAGKEWSRIREFTRSSPTEVVWELVLGDPNGGASIGWATYGGDRLPGLLP